MTSDRQQLVDEIQERLRRMTWQGRLLLRRRVERFGLTLPQYVVLVKVGHLGPGATMSHVCDAIQLPRSSMTSIADRLVELELISRGPMAGDRRAVALRITPVGADVVATVEAAGNADLVAVAGEIPTDELAAFVGVLGKLLDGIDRLADEAPETQAGDHGTTPGESETT